MLKNNDHGQSLIELIIAGAVILIAFSAFLGASISAYSGVVISQEYLIANNLAKEGIEIVRNIRDTNWLAGNDFNQGLLAGNYIVDYNDTVLTIANNCTPADIFQADECCLFLDDNGFYAVSGTLNTKYYRIIEIKDISNGIQVLSLIKWKSKKGEESIALTADLYDWY